MYLLTKEEEKEKFYWPPVQCLVMLAPTSHKWIHPLIKSRSGSSNNKGFVELIFSVSQINVAGNVGSFKSFPVTNTQGGMDGCCAAVMCLRNKERVPATNPCSAACPCRPAVGGPGRPDSELQKVERHDGTVKVSKGFFTGHMSQVSPFIHSFIPTSISKYFPFTRIRSKLFFFAYKRYLDMRGSRWCRLLPSPAARWWGLASCCNRWPRAVGEVLTRALPPWWAGCWYLATNIVHQQRERKYRLTVSRLIWRKKRENRSWQGNDL